MPIIRKLIQVGTSKAITIPKSWLEYYQKILGAEIRELAIEVNKTLTIHPVFPEEKEAVVSNPSGCKRGNGEMSNGDINN